jgi:hypothetical protein
VIREMAKNLGVSDKGSKLDIINRIKSALNIEGTFLKLFSKMWGGSGKKYAFKYFKSFIQCCKLFKLLFRHQFSHLKQFILISKLIPLNVYCTFSPALHQAVLFHAKSAGSTPVR